MLVVWKKKVLPQRGKSQRLTGALQQPAKDQAFPGSGLTPQDFQEAQFSQNLQAHVVRRKHLAEHSLGAYDRQMETQPVTPDRLHSPPTDNPYAQVESGPIRLQLQVTRST